MKKTKIYIFLLVFVISCFSFLSNTYAECSNSEYSKASNLANLIKLDIRYLGQKSDDEYGILISGMSDEFVVYANDKVYFNNDIIDGLLPKQTYKINIVYNKNIDCSMKMNYTRKIVIPSYNKYYKNDVCINNGDIEYCSVTFDSSNMSETAFNYMVSNYLTSLNSTTIEHENYLNIGLIFGIIIGFLLLLIIIILLLIRRKKKLIMS